MNDKVNSIPGILTVCLRKVRCIIECKPRYLPTDINTNNIPTITENFHC